MYFPFFDTFACDDLTNARLTVGPVRKENLPLMTEGYTSTPQVRWEQRIDNGYPNVFYDEEYGLYRCYYTCCILDDNSTPYTLQERVGRKYTIGENSRRRIAGVLYAESKDGVHWSRPALGNVAFEGSRENNILLWDAHGASVFKDMHETDPARRYKMMVRHDAKNQMAVSFSADGLHFCEPIPWPEYNPAGDTHNFAFFDERLGRYVLITRTWDGLRVVARSESDDFIHWSEPVNIYRGEGFDDQIYAMPVFRYEDLYVGLPAIFHGGDRSLPDFDCVDCEMTFSHDGVQWERVAPGTPFIPRGAGRYGDGVPDCGCIYPSSPVQEGDDLVFYYMGGSGQHTNFRESTLMRCRVNRRFLAGYVQRDESAPGQIATFCPRFGGGEVRLAAQVAAGGRVEYALCHARRGFYGELKEIPGFGFADCVPVTESGVTALTFREKTLADAPKAERGKCCPVLVFRFSGAAVYGLEGDLDRAFRPRR